MRDFRFIAWIVLCAAVVGSPGCRTGPPLPPVDLSAPGWNTRQGQVAWTRKSGAPEIAGELIVATGRNGSGFLQFSKTLPFIVARIEPNRWEFQVVPENRSWRAPGNPPKRLSWLILLRALGDNSAPAPPWNFSRTGEEWSLANPETGEKFRGYFNP